MATTAMTDQYTQITLSPEQAALIYPEWDSALDVYQLNLYPGFWMATRKLATPPEGNAAALEFYTYSPPEEGETIAESVERITRELRDAYRRTAGGPAEERKTTNTTTVGEARGRVRETLLALVEGGFEERDRIAAARLLLEALGDVKPEGR